MTVLIFSKFTYYANSSTARSVCGVPVCFLHAYKLGLCGDAVGHEKRQDVARGRSPFTIVHAKQIKFMAWMFVVGFVLNIFISPDFVELMHVGEANLGVSIARAISTLHLDGNHIRQLFVSRFLLFGSTGVVASRFRRLPVGLEYGVPPDGAGIGGDVARAGQETARPRARYRAHEGGVVRIRQAKMRGIRMDTSREVCLELTASRATSSRSSPTRVQLVSSRSVAIGEARVGGRG